MSATLKLGTDGNWATKKEAVLSYNDENNNFKPLPFTFDRASTATVVNSDGLIETVGIDQPRIDFLNNSKGHLLLEPSRQNKITTSNDFNGAAWSLSNFTATAEQVISPDGTLNASKLQATGDGSLRNQSEVSFNDGYVYSIFVKKGNSRYVTIRSAFFTQSFSCGFDLDTLTTEANGKIEDYGNDWYRLSITKNISGDADKSGFFYIYLPNSLGSTTSVSGNYAYFYGGQIEEGSYATSYIPTSGSAVTRSAETGVDCLLPNETIIDNSTATVYFEFEALADDASNRWISFEEVGTATDNQFEIRLAEGSDLLQIVTRSAGGGQDVVMTETLTDITANNKIAFNYNGLNWKLAVNGTITDTATAARLFNDNIEKIKFSRYTNTNNFYGKVKDVKVYNTALTDAELIALTTI